MARLELCLQCLLDSALPLQSKCARYAVAKWAPSLFERAKLSARDGGAGDGVAGLRANFTGCDAR